jgi:hypothetical protein
MKGIKKIKDMLRNIFNLPKKVSIEWSYPQKIDILLTSSKLKQTKWGIYQISAKLETDVQCLYIGKAWNNFEVRLKSHKKGWFDSYKGEKIVRFGEIKTRINETQLLEIESAIIFNTNPLHNRKCINSYKLNYDYEISNIGFRGEVASIVRTIEH